MMALLSILFASCQKMDQPKDYTVSVEASVTNKFGLEMNLDGNILGETTIPGLNGLTKGEHGYVIYEGVVDFDLEKTLNELEIGPAELTALKLTEDIIIKNKIAGSTDLSQFAGLALMTGDGKVIARIDEGGSQDQVKLKIETQDILSLLQQGKLDIKLVAIDVAPLQNLPKLDLELLMKLFISGGTKK